MLKFFLNSESIGVHRFSENYTEQHLKLNRNSRLYVGIENDASTKFTELHSKNPKSAIWGGWEQMYPNPRDRISWSDFFQLSQLITEVIDQKFTHQIENVIDIDNVIDYYLFTNLSYGYDNVGKNWFFLKRESNLKFEILPWDLDATWGRDELAEPVSSDLLVKNRLFDRLMRLNPNDFKTKLKARWESLRGSQFEAIRLNAMCLLRILIKLLK